MLRMTCDWLTDGLAGWFGYLSVASLNKTWPGELNLSPLIVVRHEGRGVCLVDLVHVGLHLCLLGEGDWGAV